MDVSFGSRRRRPIPGHGARKVPRARALHTKRAGACAPRPVSLPITGGSAVDEVVVAAVAVIVGHQEFEPVRRADLPSLSSSEVLLLAGVKLGVATICGRGTPAGYICVDISVPRPGVTSGTQL